MARPSKYSKALADKICARIAEGESLVRICKDPKMPHRSTVLKWRGENDEFSDKYAHAYEMGADKAFEEMEELAATATPETVGVVKLQLDARKWTLARKMPKKYGDKVQQEITGAGGGPVRTESSIEWNIQPVKPVNEPE
ncbi:hypothetical protein A3724_16610 [Alcanivorax sp. HI0033]|uniref:terminase small subunit-like protein n=1 Tax=unclassified Alcanivorax TaxID=2638842 RepID=UPI0007BAD974|nr:MULTISPECIES: hypothetical protein [unclassified Alcanivorax]KZX65735.1 hypothetical protein A3714_15000 [Alcanivorax sp. HI0007]KZX78115.1 hypothetical protein A3717_11600 [Alcanivorax sp. HI0013]KZX79883.1 hypothetical protein A3716_17735 [Alcanivorax sp. HI0011]KZY14090.1 hypothetical protein A3725_01465 [Alcanivorax sp. HI0035]KZX61293.1 hypothetical protein A3713_10000 [Alcanivorax sp. HI0003]